MKSFFLFIFLSLNSLLVSSQAKITSSHELFAYLKLKGNISIRLLDTNLSKTLTSEKKDSVITYNLFKRDGVNIKMQTFPFAEIDDAFIINGQKKYYAKDGIIYKGFSSLDKAAFNMQSAQTFLLKTKKRKYFVLEGGLLAATGISSNYLICLVVDITSPTNPIMYSLTTIGIGDLSFRWGDLDQDGYLDFINYNFNSQSQLYRLNAYSIKNGKIIKLRGGDYIDVHINFSKY